MLKRAFVSCKFMRDKLYFSLSFLFCKSLSLDIFDSSALLCIPPRNVVVNDSRPFFSAVSSLTCWSLNLFSRPAFFLRRRSSSFSNFPIKVETCVFVSLCTCRFALSKSSSGTTPKTFCVLRTVLIRLTSRVAYSNDLMDELRSSTELSSIWTLVYKGDFFIVRDTLLSHPQSARSYVYLT